MKKLAALMGACGWTLMSFRCAELLGPIDALASVAAAAGCAVCALVCVAVFLEVEIRT